MWSITIFIIVFIDLLGFGLILPLLPYYAETFGATPTVVGLLVASYAAAQLLGAPVLGRLSDKYGRRPILLVSIFGTVMGFMLLGVAKTLIILFISRILDGLTGGNISVKKSRLDFDMESGIDKDQVQQALDRTFTKRRFANHHAAAIVLDCSCKDFRSGSTSVSTDQP